MFNVAVINLKNLIKGILKIIIVAVIVTMIFKFATSKRIGFKAHVGMISSNIRINSGQIRNNKNLVLRTELVGLTKFEEKVMEKEKTALIRMQRKGHDRKRKTGVYVNKL